jgi:hypothetical protein
MLEIGLVLSPERPSGVGSFSCLIDE